MASQFELLLRDMWHYDNAILQEIFENDAGTWTAEVCISKTEAYEACGYDTGQTPEEAILNAVDVAKGNRVSSIEGGRDGK